jgi:hypothetical protein
MEEECPVQLLYGSLKALQCFVCLLVAFWRIQTAGIGS